MTTGKTIRVRDLASARSGDKGNHANIGVVAHDEDAYAILLSRLTAVRVQHHFQELGVSRVERYELPKVLALNFVLYDALAGGASRSLRTDTQGKLLILTDTDNGYALSLGLVVWLGDRLKDLMQGRGVHLDEIQGNDGWFLPLPATFVVDSGGTVVLRHVDPDFRLRMEVNEIVEALRRAQRHSRRDVS